jgi:hypothetical protein
MFEEAEKEKGLPSVRFLDLEKNTEKRFKLEKAVHSVTISPDETVLAGASSEGIYLWTVSDLAKKAK